MRNFPFPGILSDGSLAFFIDVEGFEILRSGGDQDADVRGFAQFPVFHKVAEVLYPVFAAVLIRSLENQLSTGMKDKSPYL